MGLLVLGIVLWSVVHLSVRVTPGVRQALIDRVGRFPYQGLFSLPLILALVCMVVGWKAIGPGEPYYVLAGARLISMALMVVAACLFIASNAPTDIKRVVRHPQLISVVLWSFAHLYSNSDTRSLVLFGGLAVWAMLEIVVINRAEGEWQKPAPVGAVKTSVSAAIGLVVFAVLLFIHPWLAGVALI